MYRLVKLSNQWYGYEIDSVVYDEENIEQFVEEGDIVLLCQDLDDLTDLGIDKDDIQIVERD